MKKQLLTLLFSLLVWPLAVFALDSKSAVGQPAPDFSAVDLDGKNVSLSDYKGKLVVLEWFNEGCPFVKKHYESNNMQKLQERYATKGVVWLIINSSGEGKEGYKTPAGHKQTWQNWGIKATNFLLDTPGTIGKLYGAKTTPHMFIINQQGVLVYAGAIDSKPSTAAKDIPGATNYVSAALDELLSGKTVTVASTNAYGCGVKYAS
ncbi:MAG TPA: thioredoxin family protein [Oligoflexia bacterium]|nr:thioredoxin family protein [Oligoflexia bacterium]HMP26712.1 thioredoxin family protein [Oligoflexia bacterium]